MLDTKLVVSCFLVIFITTAHAHFRIGKRGKFVNRHRSSTQQLPQSEVSDFFRRVANSHNLCQRFAKSTNAGLFKEDVVDFVIEKIESDIEKLKSHQQNPLAKYKALSDLLEEYCVQRALTKTLPEAENAEESLADESEIYRK